MLRIALVSHRFLPNVGGVERHVAELARELTERGHEVTVFTSDDVRSDEDAEPVPETPYDVRRFPTVLPDAPIFREQLVARGLLRDLEAWRPDVIHAHAYAFYPFTAAWRASKRLDVPLVVSPHYWPSAIEKLPWHLRNALKAYDHVLGRRIFARDAASVCAVGRTEGNILMERFGVPATRLHWTPNGVRPEDVEGEPGFSETYGVDDDFVLFLGRLSRQKGVHHLIRVAPRVDAPVVIAGPDWGEGKKLKKLARDEGADEHVRFLGTLPRDMALSAMAEASAFAMPTHWEALSVVLLEAWANAAPVAGSDVGGMKDVLTHGRDSLVHPVGDEEAFLEHLHQLLDDPALQGRLGAAGRENVRREYTWGTMTDRVEAAYRAALHGTDRHDGAAARSKWWDRPDAA